MSDDAPRGHGGAATPTMPAPVALLALVLLAAAGCSGGDDESSSWSTTRDTLETGVVRVVNAPPAAGPRPGYVIEEELRIGTIEGSGADQFGQVRGIAALADGRIAVLDAQAKEVRLFDPSGAHLASFARQGAGPGELEGPWGLIRDPGDRLWVPDHSNDRMTVFHPDSGYIRSYPMTVLRYGFIWAGAMLDDGRIVKPSITLFPERRDMLRVYGPEMALVDSILMPEPGGPPVDPQNPPSSFYWEAPGGMPRGYMTVPFYPRSQTVYAPTAEVWSSHGGAPAYRISRASLRGDTTLIIETRREPVPVPEATRDSAIDAIREAIRERGGNTSQDWSKVPRVKPPVEQMFVSDDDQLWVRTASPDSLVHFDVYDPDGSFDRTVVTDLALWPYLSPIVRGDRVWGVVTDEFGVQYVVRGRIRGRGAAEGT